MTLFKKREILPTLKITVENSDENGVVFDKDMQVKINGDIQQTTKYGEKTILTIEDSSGKKYNLFLNTKSINNLLEAFGEDSENWKGKLANLRKEKDSYYNKDSIVVYGVK